MSTSSSPLADVSASRAFSLVSAFLWTARALGTTLQSRLRELQQDGGEIVPAGALRLTEARRGGAEIALR